jgi:hypothetical protein
MRKSLGTAAFLILCSASASNAEPDTAIDHAPAPVEAAQGPNMTVVPDRNANVSTAQTENDAAINLPSVSIAPNASCDTLNSAAERLLIRYLFEEGDAEILSCGRESPAGDIQDEMVLRSCHRLHIAHG